MPSEIFRPGLLEDQVIVVTGGGTGLGRATAIELTALGATVVVAGRRIEPLEETAKLCEGTCEPVVLDIREEEQVHAFVDGVVERHGRIHTLVNNAGGQFLSPAEDISSKGFRAVVKLNLEGTWLMTQTVATKSMIPSGGGKVISVTLSPHHGLPGMVHSSAARAAVENMMRVLSIEWSRFDIKLNAIATGHFETDAIQKYPEPVKAGVAKTVPLGRMGRPIEQAWLVAYLASPAGDYCSGAIFTVDGARDNWLGPYPPVGLADETGKPLAEERRPRPE
jgi:citronellol/citronellal dehydrogenase